MEWVGILIGAFVGVIILYFVIRMAVTHALIAARPKAPTQAVEAPEPKTWFNQEPS